MLKHRWTDRVCCAVLVVTLLLTAGYMGAAVSGLIVRAERTGYETRLFDTARVHSIDIVMNDWEDFLKTCTSEEYASCTAVIDGEKYANIAIRAKGNTSLSSVAAYGNNRYSFKIEFDHYVSTKSYYGLDKLCLNNIIQDNTYVKDYLAYTMMKKMGVATPLCSFAYITVNGQDWGLYLAVEAVEDAFMLRNYGGQGELYKPDSMSFGGGRGNGRDFDMDEFREKFREENGDASAQTEDSAANLGSSTGAQGGFAPSNGGTQGGTNPSNGGTQAGTNPSAGVSQGSVPNTSENAAPNNGAFPNEGGGVPNNGGTLPDMSNMPNGGAFPNAGGGASDNGSALPDMSNMPNGGAFPNAGGGASDNGGTLPDMSNMPNGGAFPNAGGGAPDNGGTFPDMSNMPNGGVFPNAGGGAPDNGSALPDMSNMPNGGAFPNAGSGMPNSDGSFPNAEGGFPEAPQGMGFGGFGGFGSNADVQLQYIDDNPDSYPNIFGNAKTDVTEEDQNRLIASLKALSEGDASVVEQDAVLRYIAVHNFLCNDDSYTGMMVHNYYLHENDGILSMIPWDYNLSMGGMGMNSGDATETVNSPIDSLVSMGNASSRPMAAWITADEETLNRYHAIYGEFMDNAASEGWFTDELDALFEMIDPYVAKDPTAFCTYEDFLTARAALKEFCVLRAQSVSGQLDGTIPATSEAQRTDRSSLVDASHLALTDMGSMNGMGGGAPGGMPGGMPSGMPGAMPSGKPSGMPDAMPSGKPDAMPNGKPEAMPSGKPEAVPSEKPSLGTTSGEDK